MLAKLKLAAYGLLLILALWFAWGFHVNYSATTPDAALVDACGTRKLMISYFAGLILAIVDLGILIACDVVRQFAHRTVDMLLDDDGSAAKDPEYERGRAGLGRGPPNGSH